MLFRLTHDCNRCGVAASMFGSFLKANTLKCKSVGLDYSLGIFTCKWINLQGLDDAFIVFVSLVLFAETGNIVRKALQFLHGNLPSKSNEQVCLSFLYCHSFHIWHYEIAFWKLNIMEIILGHFPKNLKLPLMKSNPSNSNCYWNDL